MPVTSVNKIKSFSVFLQRASSDLQIIYQSPIFTLGQELFEGHTIISANAFVKNIKAFAKIRSIDPAPIPDFDLEDSQTDKLVKTLDVEWLSPRKQLDLFLSSEGQDFNLIGSVSLLNPQSYPFRIYNLLDLFTDNLALELGSNSKISAQIVDAGYGLLSNEDQVTIHGSYVEEFFVKYADQPIKIYVTGSSGNSGNPNNPPSNNASSPAIISLVSDNFVPDQLLNIWAQSSSQYSVLQETVVLQPISRGNIVNNKAAAYFDGSTYLEIKFNQAGQISQLFPVSSDWNIFIVGQFLENSQGSIFTVFNAGSETPNAGIQIKKSEVLIGTVDQNNSYQSYSVGYSLNESWNILLFKKTGNNFSFYINGILQNSIETTNPLSETQFLQYCYLGENFQGYIAELLIYYSLTQQDANLVGSYLKNKFNLNWTNL